MSSEAPVQRNYLPSCWDDDLRMQALFSIVRKKELNPTGWQEKMDFWILAINNYCKKMKQGVITANQIRSAFVRESKYPNCIDEVLNHMGQQQMLENADSFADSDSNSWIGWGYNGVKKTISWGWTLAMSFVREQVEQPHKVCTFVVLDVVREMADNILKRHAELIEMEKADYIIELSDLQSYCKDICTGDSFRYALVLLQKEKKVLKFTENDKQFLKFPKEDKENKAISEADKAVVKLKHSVETVSKQIEGLEKEIDICSKSAKQLLQSGHKVKAVNVLKKRKRLENELKRKITSMDNLETLLTQLQTAESGKHVLDAYSTGVAAMKSCLTGELDADKVDTTIANLQDMTEELADIELMLSKGVVENDDDHDLEEELEAILSPQKNKTSPRIDIERDEEELMRRLNALKQPSTNVSPVSKSSAHGGMSRYKHAAALQ